MDFDEIMKRLSDIAGRGGGATSQSSNPADYPRSVCIETSDEAMMAFQTLEHYQTLLEQAGSAFELAYSKYRTARAEFFLTAEKVYPDVARARGSAGTAWRLWRGKIYYVGYNEHKDAESDAGGGETPQSAV